MSTHGKQQSFDPYQIQISNSDLEENSTLTGIQPDKNSNLRQRNSTLRRIRPQEKFDPDGEFNISPSIFFLLLKKEPPSHRQHRISSAVLYSTRSASSSSIPHSNPQRTSFPCINSFKTFTAHPSTKVSPIAASPEDPRPTANAKPAQNVCLIQHRQGPLYCLAPAAPG